MPSRCRSVSFVGALLFASTVAAEPFAGNYVRVGTSKDRVGLLRVYEVKHSHVTLDLQLEFNPYPERGGMYTRSGELTSEVVPLKGNIAVYAAPPEEVPACKITFQFLSATQVTVLQKGECSWFGVGVNATGNYMRQPSKANTQ